MISHSKIRHLVILLPICMLLVAINLETALYIIYCLIPEASSWWRSSMFIMLSIIDHLLLAINNDASLKFMVAKFYVHFAVDHLLLTINN